MAKSEQTRVAIPDLMAWYMKGGWDAARPTLWMCYAKLPEHAAMVSGFTTAYILGDRMSITLIDAPFISGVRYEVPVPFMPFAGEGPHAGVPDFDHPFKLVANGTMMATANYFERTGAQLVKASKVDLNNCKPWNLILLEMKRILVKGGDGGVDLGLSIEPELLHGLLEPKTLCEMPGKRKSLTVAVHSERCGSLMKGHEGTLEFHGFGVPCVIRSHDESMVSIMMAPGAEEIERAVRRIQALKGGAEEAEPAVDQPVLPGFTKEEQTDGGSEAKA